MEVFMKTLRMIWPAVTMVLAAACSNSGPVTLGKEAFWAIGLTMDSLTPASRLYASPSWAFFIVPLTSPLLSRGTLSRDDVGRYARCWGPAVRLDGTRQVWYNALGDTMYSSDSAAYWQAINRLAQGGNSSGPLFDSLLRGDFDSTLPGLVILVTPSFDPTAASASGRGATAATAVLRHWAWRDGGRTFAEDTARASLTACGLS
jgi:hypothetical protein